MCYGLHMERCERSSCVCSYHMYRAFWDVVIGEDLVCLSEPSNEHGRYAVAVSKDGVIIRNLLQTISQHCCLFLKIGGI